MHRFRRRMLVVFLPLSLALFPGCVCSTAPRDLVATDNVAETPSLPADPFIPSGSAINEPTVFTDAAAENAEKPAPSPQPKLTPSPSLPIVNYTVGNGETLWSIAARSNIYADALLWPLLYQANRDQIRDPRQIYPGQTLSIPRNASEEQKEEAREAARRSKIFPDQP